MPIKGKNTCHLSNLETQVAKFWEIEEISIHKPISYEGEECEAHFRRTTTPEEKGRYIVRLPFRRSDQRLGELRSGTLKRLNALERRFERNASLKTEYAGVMEDYLRLDHMSVINEPDDDGYYMPHHAVIKESSITTKVRVVFDASAKTANGVSLNDLLMIGPTIQPKLISHLLRLRTYRHVLIAEIEKMYRQVRVHDEYRRYQRILWRIKDKIQTLQINTLTFGAASSPFLAIRVLIELANNERLKYPSAAEILTKHLYVDDLLSGANDVAEARAIRDGLAAFLKLGGFTIRQWASDDERIIGDVESSAIHKNFTSDANRCLKTLGMTWSACDDKFYYSTRTIGVLEKWTKRAILSEIAKIFNPVGLLGPVTLREGIDANHLAR